MTLLRAAGVVLIALGLIYAVMYAGWLRRSRRKSPDSVALEFAPAGGSTFASAKGMYVSTTMAISRNERVSAAGLGMRAPATTLVHQGSIRWEREGTGEVVVAGTQLLGVSLERGLARKLLRRAGTVLVSWHSDDGDRYATSFLPRRRDDAVALVQGVEQLMRAGAPIRDEPGSTPRTEARSNGQNQSQTTPDGTH